MIFRICLLSFFFLSFFSCQEQSESTAEKKISPFNSSDYTYFTKTFSGDNPKEGYELEKVLEKSYQESYKQQPANYKLVAYKLKKSGDNSANSLLIEMEIDRMQSSIVGSGKRNRDTRYICLPSDKSPEDLHNKYNISIRELGYKDYEVYTAFLSRLFSKSLF